MNIFSTILLFLLLGSLHLSFFGLYVESYVVFYCMTIVLLCVNALYLKIRIRLDGVNLFVAMYCLCIYLSLVIRGNNYGSERYYFILQCWLLFFALRGILTYKNMRTNIVWIIVSCVYFEIMVGFGQMFGLLESGNENFQFGGTFCNPGAYASYLSLMSPIVLSAGLVYRRNRKSENRQYILLSCFVFMIYLIAVSLSRGAWISCLIGCLYVLDYHFRILSSVRRRLIRKIRLVAVYLFIAVFAIGTVALAYNIKSDSADGRLFIWKVTMKSLHENRFWGDGIGSFAANYSKWQREYFANNGGDEQERYLADYVTCAYNEFLEAFHDQGIAGLGLFVGIILVSLFQKNKHRSTIFVGAKASLLGFIVLCSVAYPLQLSLVYLHLIVTLALLFPYSDMVNNEVCSHKRKLAHMYICFMSMIVFILGIRHLYGVKLLDDGQRKVLCGDIRGALAAYEDAYHIMHNNGRFLFYYGSALSLNGDIEKCAEILKEAENRTSDPNVFILLGNNYKEMNDFSKARIAYRHAINTIPSRLYPRYLMVKLLMDFGHKAEAYVWANEVLNTKEKVVSLATKEIKDEMRLIINRLSNEQNRLPME